MGTVIQRIRVSIPAHKTLRIYDPQGPAKPVIRGKVELEGVVRSINGVEWVIFPTQRGYGIPINDEEEKSSVDYDLELASKYDGITYKRIREETKTKERA